MGGSFSTTFVTSHFSPHCSVKAEVYTKWLGGKKLQRQSYKENVHLDPSAHPLKFSVKHDTTLSLCANDHKLVIRHSASLYLPAMSLGDRSLHHITSLWSARNELLAGAIKSYEAVATLTKIEEGCLCYWFSNVCPPSTKEHQDPKIGS